MQFKGTPSLGKGAIFAEISRNGGVNNAMTSNDWTAYYETLPVDRLDLAIKIEADRMSNSLFDPAETESERTVILSERQGAENNPGYLLYEEVIGAAFRAHPLPAHGDRRRSDLKAMSRDDLFAHYKLAYSPANAFIVAAGDFDASELADRIEAAFGAIPTGEPLPPVRAVEPAQRGERRVTLRRPRQPPICFRRITPRTAITPTCQRSLSPMRFSPEVNRWAAAAREWANPRDCTARSSRPVSPDPHHPAMIFPLTRMSGR